MNFHRSLAVIVAALVAAVVSSSAGRALALDRDLAYLHSLQTRGFGDVAVNYLETLDKKNELSPGVREVFDLEMSKSLRAEAQNPPDPAQRGALLAKSQKFLDQFVKNNPNHPEALQAQVSSAEMMFDHAQEMISASRAIKDKTEKATSLTQSRSELTQVKAILQPAIDKLIAQLKGLGPRPTRMVNRQLVLIAPQAMTRKEKDQEAKREELDFDLIRTAGELALVDYFKAQTYVDPANAADRKLALNTAAKALDLYYQQHRNDDPLSKLGRTGFIGAQYAHTWYGKAVEELNDPGQAKDVYDEVLANMPDPPDPKKAKVDQTGLEPSLARAKFYSLQLLANDPKQQKAYLDQAEDFLTSYKRLFGGEWGYQATSLDVAKRLLLASAEKETNAKEKAALTARALAYLKDMASVRSEFQDEATQLRLSISRGANPTTVEEALEFIRLAFNEKDWGKVEALCQTALDLLKKSNKKDAESKALQGKIQDWLAESQIQPTFDDFAKNREPFKQEKYQAWLETAEKMAQENKKSVIAPRTGAFAVYCAAVLYDKSRYDDQQSKTAAAKTATKANKDKAFERFQEVVNFMLSSFPNSPEADEARLALAKAQWSDDKVDDAIAAFKSINPKSEKYPEALRLIGTLQVGQFQKELKKPAAQQDQALIEKLRAEAVKALTDSIAQQMDAHKPDDAYPPDLIKTQLLLAKVHMQVNDHDAAIKVLQPLIAAADAAKGKTQLDETMLQIFSAAVKAYMAKGDFQKAGAAGNTLIDLGPDKREVNVVLVDFVRRLDIELKELRDKIDKLADTAPKETEILDARKKSIMDMMKTMVVKLADRKELDANMMVFLGSLFTDIDDFDGAKDQYKKVQNLPGVSKKLQLWVGAQLVDILGKQGRLEEATDEVAKLRKDYPNNLDFMKVEAQLWQEWGRKDPSRYETAIQKWLTIRLRLQHQKKLAGTTYYDAIYNAAFCYYLQANKLALDPNKKAQARSKAENGEKTLKSEMILFPKLDGPQTVKRFNDLLTDLDKLLKKLPPA
jgi:hypothetical protein